MKIELASEIRLLDRMPRLTPRAYHGAKAQAQYAIKAFRDTLDQKGLYRALRELSQRTPWFNEDDGSLISASPGEREWLSDTLCEAMMAAKTINTDHVVIGPWPLPLPSGHTRQRRREAGRGATRRSVYIAREVWEKLTRLGVVDDVSDKMIG